MLWISRLLLIALFLLPMRAAQAHPHAFIDLKTGLILDSVGRLTAIYEHWLFDKYYTEFALHDFAYKKDGALDTDKLMKLAMENLKGLKDYDYFTSFDKGTTPMPKIGMATDVKSYLDHGQIALDFTVPLSVPVELAHRKTSFKIYDPSYYTAMLQVQGVPIAVIGTLPAGCKAGVNTPKPAAAWKTLAQALDKNATAPDNLGIYFAETIEVTCP